MLREAYLTPYIPIRLHVVMPDKALREVRRLTLVEFPAHLLITSAFGIGAIPVPTHISHSHHLTEFRT